MNNQLNQVSPITVKSKFLSKTVSTESLLAEVDRNNKKYCKENKLYNEINIIIIWLNAIIVP